MLIKANFVKDQDLSSQIGRLFEEGFLKTRRADSFIQKVTFAPSSIGPKYNGSCSRRWFLAFKGQDWEEKTRSISLAIMAAGTDAHTRLQKILEDSGHAAAIEQEATFEDPPIRGFIDAIIDLDGRKVVAEFKTTKHAMFEHYAFAGKPNVAHRIQVMIYMMITGIKDGIVMYQSANTKELVVIPVEYDDVLMDKVLGWMRRVYKAYQDDTLPERDYRIIGKMTNTYSAVCSQCPVLKACESQPAGVVSIGRLVVE